MEAIRQKKRDAEARREEIQGIVDDIKLKGEELDVLIFECIALTDPGEISVKKREIRRKASRVDKCQEDLSMV
jgi:hypothetical protein